ncbi:MAG TPA: protein kinase [Gemmatimonadales bacterium]|nr:protein kinase [Gemmatimonadales bacterium]
MRLNRLGFKVFGATVAVVVLVLGGALYLTKVEADKAASASIGRALGATRSAIQGELDARASALRQSTAIFAKQSPVIARIEKAVNDSQTSDLLDADSELVQQTGAAWALVTDGAGVLRAWSLHRAESGDDFSGASLIAKALQGQPSSGVWIEVDSSSGTPHDVLYQAVAVPVRRPGNNPVAVLVAALPIDSVFVRALNQQTASDIVFFTLDTLGHPRVTLSTLPIASGMAEAMAGAMAGMSMGQMGMAVDSTLRAAGDSGRVTIDGGGDVWVGTVGGLLNADGEPLGGYVGLRSRARELAAYTGLERTMVLVFVVGVILALIISSLVARQVTRPIARLVEATREVREGRFSGSIDIRSSDEVGELAGAFRRMISDLKEKQDLVEYLSAAGAGSTLALTAAERQNVTGSGAPPPMRPSQATSLLTPGSTFAGRYAIREILGAGGMGVVYRAMDTQLQELVAIKTLKPDAMGAENVERFKQEIRLARRITHRNVVRTHDLGEADGTLFITMEYVEGKSLAEVLRKRGRLPASVALTVARQLCRALEAAHEMGVIHRDIKPQNIAVEPTGVVKVMDFGIARLTEGRPEGSKGLTAVGTVIGTPEYMSPEQLMGAELDARSDLYSAGAVLFECVTGRAVFEAPNVTALIIKHVEEEPVDPRTLVPEVPHDLALLILKALAKPPAARFQTAAEMGEALDEVELPVERVSGAIKVGAV